MNRRTGAKGNDGFGKEKNNNYKKTNRYNQTINYIVRATTTTTGLSQQQEP